MDSTAAFLTPDARLGHRSRICGNLEAAGGQGERSWKSKCINLIKMGNGLGGLCLGEGMDWKGRFKIFCIVSVFSLLLRFH